VHCNAAARLTVLGGHAAGRPQWAWQLQGGGSGGLVLKAWLLQGQGPVRPSLGLQAKLQRSRDVGKLFKV